MLLKETSLGRNGTSTFTGARLYSPSYSHWNTNTDNMKHMITGSGPGKVACGPSVPAQIEDGGKTVI